MLNLVMLGGLHACLFASASAQVAWRVVDERVVQLLDGQSACAATPSEGLWTVGLGWKDGWPAEWRHAAPVSSELVGGWTVLRGALSIDGGEMLLRDAYREEDGVLRARRRYEWRGERPLRQATLTVRWLALDAPSIDLGTAALDHRRPARALGPHESGERLDAAAGHVPARRLGPGLEVGRGNDRVDLAVQ